MHKTSEGMETLVKAIGIPPGMTFAHAPKIHFIMWDMCRGMLVFGLECLIKL